jgi:hypothetical protein
MTPPKTMRLGPFRTAVVHLECVLRSSQLSKKGGRCTQCGVMTYSSIRKVLFSFNYSLKNQCMFQVPCLCFFFSESFVGQVFIRSLIPIDGNLLLRTSHAVESFVAVLCLRPKPHGNLPCVCIRRSHQCNLTAAFVRILLI